MLLGGGLEPLGLSLAVFWLLFLRLCAQEGLRGPKRRPRALLGSILGGFGGVWGGVWEDFGAQNCGFLGFLSRHGDDDAVCRNSGSRHIAFFRDLAGLGPTWNVMDPHFGRLIEAELVLEGRCGQAKA